MNEEGKEDIELDIEAKYVDKTEKEFLSRVTYAECLYILTPKNKYCDKIRELSVLKLCEIIEKLKKENETLKAFTKSIFDGDIEKEYISVQKVKDKIEEYKNMLKTCNKAKDIDRIKAINERILELQELLEGRKENEI